MNRHEHVRHIMSSPPVAVEASMRPSAVRELFAESAFHHLPVLDKGVLVGIISHVDLARVSLKAWVRDDATDEAWLDSQYKVEDLMTPEPEFVRASDTVRTAADKLSSGVFHALPVLDDTGDLVGIVTSTDLLRLIAV